jgi:hypothetical protein
LDRLATVMTLILDATLREIIAGYRAATDHMPDRMLNDVSFDQTDVEPTLDHRTFLELGGFEVRHELVRDPHLAGRASPRPRPSRRARSRDARRAGYAGAADWVRPAPAAAGGRVRAAKERGGRSRAQLQRRSFTRRESWRTDFTRSTLTVRRAVATMRPGI